MKKIAFNAAVELSYLGSLEQANVLQAIEEEETAPSIAQATKMHKFSKEKKLDFEAIYDIMREGKTEKFKVTFKEDKLRKYFPKDYTAKQIEKFILQKQLENSKAELEKPFEFEEELNEKLKRVEKLNVELSINSNKKENENSNDMENEFDEDMEM